MSQELFKEWGRFTSYYCQDCGEHINEQDPPIYVKVEVSRANPTLEEVDVAGWAKKFVDIMSRPIPSIILCLECAHTHFVDKLEVLPGNRTSKKK